MSNSSPLLLERALDSWPQWRWRLQSRPLLLAELSGGLTNRSFRVVVRSGEADRFAVVRLNAPDPQALGINRQREAQILDCVASGKLAPEVIYRGPTHRFLVTAWVEGHHLGPGDLDNATVQQRLAQLIDRIQALTPDLPRFDYLQQVRRYRQLARSRHPAEMDRLESRLRQFLGALESFQSGNWPPVLCHHDLTPENLIDTPAGLAVLDWEYAAMGHPGFDRIRLGLSNPADAADTDFLRELLTWLDRLWLLARD